MTHIKDNHVACDGGKLGHPLIYLTLLPHEDVTCPYCSRVFSSSPSAFSVEIDKNS